MIASEKIGNSIRLNASEEIGNRIRTIRKLQKISQNELSSRSGLNKATLCRLENGQRIPTAQTLIKLANALGVPATDFMDIHAPIDGPQTDDFFVNEIGKYIRKFSIDEQKDVLEFVKMMNRWKSSRMITE